MNLWDRLIPQSVIKLNLLLKSRRYPNKSAYEVLNGPFNYDATPLAPTGCKIIAFESTQSRKSFSLHGSPEWYIGPTLKHTDVIKSMFLKQGNNVFVILYRFILIYVIHQ